MRRPELHGVFQLGSAKLIYRGTTTSLPLNEKFLLINSILIALPAASLHCWENLGLNAIVTPRSLMHDTLSKLVSLISQSKFWLYVPTCKTWHLLTLKRHFPSLGTFRNLSQVLLDAHPVAVSDYRVSDFRFTSKL